ncbi:uncharacterized protein LOC135170646 [Diachasmimorpha longicaudata]|uniref:uncharacterized protein LOC135170646 n=1 Tax=Diachasmimorpha longicaudata TaxID=58733 RepID=UPI0030B8895E
MIGLKSQYSKDMDFFDNPNWGLSKLLLSSFGAWPFQSSRFRYLSRYIVGFLICSLLVPEILRIFTVRGDMNLLVACTSTLLLHLLTIVKMVNCIYHLETEKKLLLQIKKHRESYSSPGEAQLLDEYGNQSQRITHGYIYYIYATTVMYMGTPMVPKILDHILPLNESRPTIFLYEAEYFVDRNAYKSWILLHSYLVTPLPATIVVAFDSLYIHFAEHACSLFSITSQRMGQLARDIDDRRDQCTSKKREDAHVAVLKCITQHMRALKFVYLLKTTYTEALFFILGINMLAISITGYQTVTKLDEPSEVLRFGSYTIGQLIHLYILSWPGQKLMDHSAQIHKTAFQGCWYNLPLDLQKFLILVMMRGSKTCTLTAGGLFVMSLQSFCLVVKTSVSNKKRLILSRQLLSCTLNLVNQLPLRPFFVTSQPGTEYTSPHLDVIAHNTGVVIDLPIFSTSEIEINDSTSFNFSSFSRHCVLLLDHSYDFRSYSWISDQVLIHVPKFLPHVNLNQCPKTIRQQLTNQPLYYASNNRNYALCTPPRQVLRKSGSSKDLFLRKMDYFKNSDWRLTKLLLSCFGAWPFQGPHLRVVLNLLVTIVLISILIPEIIKLITVYDDLNKTISCVPILALHLLTVTKMLNCLLNLKKYKLLLLEIHKDWQQNLSPADVKILKTNANKNRFITHTYIYYIYATTLMYLLGPMVPKVLDVVMPLNESRPTVEIYQTEYFVNPVKYEIPILVHAYVISPFPSTIVVAFDALYCNCVNHACSMLEIIGRRLENMVEDIDNTNQNLFSLSEESIHNSLRSCIRQHRKSLQFAQLLRTTYSKCFLSIVMINTVALTITGYQVVQNLDDMSEIIRYGTFSIGQIVHLLFLSQPAQRLMDHSGQIHSLAYQGYWYNIPMRSKKMLILIMMRSRKPSVLTAGKLYVMSLQSFARVIKTSMSYFTVLLSAR